MLFSLLSIIGIAIAIYGVITEAIPLGIIFIISLAVFLYVLFSLLNKGMRLTELGIVMFVVSLLLLMYAACYLFLDIDVKALLGL